MKTFDDLKRKLSILNVPYPTIDVIIGLSHDNIGDSEDLFPMDICLQVCYCAIGSDKKTSVSVSVDGAYYWHGEHFNFKDIEGSTYGADFTGYCVNNVINEIIYPANFPEEWENHNLTFTQQEIGKLLAEFLEVWEPEASHQAGVCFYIESM